MVAADLKQASALRHTCGCAGPFGEGLELGEDGFERTGGVGDKVHPVHADVAEYAFGAVLGEESPEPGRGGAPFAPDGGAEPSLQIAGLDVLGGHAAGACDAKWIGEFLVRGRRGVREGGGIERRQSNLLGYFVLGA